MTAPKVIFDGARIRRDGSTVDDRELLTPAEVAGLFRIDAKTVSRWAKAGKLPCIRTLGNHRRYRASVVRTLLATRDGGDADGR